MNTINALNKDLIKLGLTQKTESTLLRNLKAPLRGLQIPIDVIAKLGAPHLADLLTKHNSKLGVYQAQLNMLEQDMAYHYKYNNYQVLL